MGARHSYISELPLVHLVCADGLSMGLGAKQDQHLSVDGAAWATYRATQMQPFKPFPLQPGSPRRRFFTVTARTAEMPLSKEYLWLN